jgi:predicted protein tyrosine phosphatase
LLVSSPNKKTEKITENHMKRALFVCTQNRLRSPTAEQIFADWPNVETDSAGLGNDATTPLSSEQIAWANIIFVMEKAHRSKLSKKFKAYLSNKRIICLDIPDEYEYMDPLLITILKAKAGKFLM